MKLLIGNFIFIKCKLILQSRSIVYKDSIWACIEGYASILNCKQKDRSANSSMKVQLKLRCGRCK